MTREVSHAIDSNSGTSLADLIDRLGERVQAGEGIDLDAVARDYPHYASEVRQLLPALGVLNDLSHSHDSALAGAARREVSSDALISGVLGDFRILREVGRGGMGVVYEAEQISLGRRVALKVLPFAATIDPKQLQRFKNEAKAAASLKHENIVQVFGVGCERSTHFYAMEYIEGQTLAQLIHRLRPDSDQPVAAGDATQTYAPGGAPTKPVAALSTRHSGPRDKAFYRTAAGLMAQAADALEHAHGLGIVHRDVKPANLLLDSAGKLYVSDFGLARFGPDAGLTVSGDLLGTLRYMAPEQALARHGLVDHRADVYGLGATLYELLIGRPAVDGHERADVLRRIAFEEPVAPRRLAKAIPAELETVTLKALAKNPAERYTTAGELADDLRRFVEDRPIRARRPTVRQRLARWGRRHPGVTAALGLTAGLLLAGAGAWDREKMRAETTARAVAAEADQLRDGDRLPEALRAARQAADLLPRFGGDAALRREVAERVADLQLLHRLDEARLDIAAERADGSKGADESDFDWKRVPPLYRQAFLDYGVDVLGGDESTVVAALRRRSVAAQVAATLFEWGTIATEPASSSERLGRMAEALDDDPRQFLGRIRRAVAAKDAEALRRLAAESRADPPRPEILIRLALALRTVSLLADSESLFRAGQVHYPSNFWVNHLLADTLKDLGPAGVAEATHYYRIAVAVHPTAPLGWLGLRAGLTYAGRDEEAEAVMRRAIALNPDYALFHVALGDALLRVRRGGKADLTGLQNLEATAEVRGRFEAAETAYRRAMVLKPTNTAYTNLGVALRILGRYAEAVDAFRQATALDPNQFVAHNNLGVVLAKLQRFEEAEAAFGRAVALNPNHPFARDDHGNILGRLGRLTEALAEFRQAIDLKPDFAGAYHNLGYAFLKLGRLTEAEPAFRKAIEFNPDYAESYYDLGNVVRGLGRHDQAIELYRQAIKLNPDYAEAHCNLGQELQLKGNYAEAVAALRVGHELGRKRKNWSNPSEDWLRVAERSAAVEKNFQAFLSGAVQPSDGLESLTVALMCHRQIKFATAVRFYARAFQADPTIAERPNNYRYNAACCAIHASTDPRMEPAKRTEPRRQALDWLTEELDVRAKLAQQPTDREKLRRMLEHWQQDPDFVSVRGAAALEKLPDDERAAWQKLWDDVAALVKGKDIQKAATKAPPP